MVIIAFAGVTLHKRRTLPPEARVLVFFFLVIFSYRWVTDTGKLKKSFCQRVYINWRGGVCSPPIIDVRFRITLLDERNI